MTKLISAYCPFCDSTHEIEYVEELSTLHIYGKKVEYESRFYRCPKHPEEPEGFVTAKMMDENLQRAKIALEQLQKEMSKEDFSSEEEVAKWITESRRSENG